jgi:hypothetical protein
MKPNRQEVGYGEGEKKELLEKDLYNELRWLFVAAVTWFASENSCGNRDPLATIASLTHARALYEFFYGGERPDGDDARAFHFCAANSWNPGKTSLYLNYMASGQPANKRVFHLVYNRSNHAGGPGHDGPDHVKNQVLNFAKDLAQLTEEFIRCVEPKFKNVVGTALENARAEAKKTADSCGITSPL